MKYFWAIAVIGISIAAAFYLFGGMRHGPSMQQTTIQIGGVPVTVDVATTTADREQGLSGRTSLPQGRGMLFIFSQEGLWGFWMKDMHFSIDILWIDASGRVVTVEQLVSPSTYPETTFYPSSPARYVLEVPAGFAQLNGVEIGSQMSLPDLHALGM